MWSGSHMRYLKTHKRGPFATAASQMGVTKSSHTEFTSKGPTQIGHLVHLPTRGPSWQFTVAWQLKIQTLTGKNRGSMNLWVSFHGQLKCVSPHFWQQSINEISTQRDWGGMNHQSFMVLDDVLSFFYCDPECLISPKQLWWNHCCHCSTPQDVTIRKLNCKPDLLSKTSSLSRQIKYKWTIFQTQDSGWHLNDLSTASQREKRFRFTAKKHVYKGGPCIKPRV